MIRQTIRQMGLAAAACAALAACALTGAGDGGEAPPDWQEPSMIATPGEGPPDARPGACYGKDVTPAVIEVVTEQVIDEPAQYGPEGNIVKPAKFTTTKHQQVVTPRREVFFEVPCPNLLTPDFIASLQRALSARGFYNGQVNGVLDERTRKAIRAFQKPSGINTDILTMDSARSLGLVAYGRDDG